MRSHWSFESAVIEGISRHCPVCASNRQPWYMHSTVCPSQCPAESGNARCGHTSRIAKTLPAVSRPRTSGTSSRVEVVNARPRIWSLRSAGYQKPHSNSPSILDAVTPGIDWGWVIVMRDCTPMIYRSLVLAMQCGPNWQRGSFRESRSSRFGKAFHRDLYIESESYQLLTPSVDFPGTSSTRTPLASMRPANP